jgi:beta-glucosidase
MPWINHPNIKAVLWPGLQGQELGNTLADIVTGKVNPSGRLPYTIAKQASDYYTKPDPNTKVVYSEKLLVGYKWFDAQNIEPQFAFGHGLSYTTFAYSNLHVSSSKHGHGHQSSSDNVKVTATVTVANTGKWDGNEIVQAYISFPESAAEPPKLLRGFEKVWVKQGGKGQVSIEFTKTELSIWDTASKSWVIPSGQFTVHIGASSRDIRLSANFTL